MIRQGARNGVALAICDDLSGGPGAWRGTVEPAVGTTEAGLWFQGQQDPESGFLATLGGNPGVGGFALKGPGGKVLWEDRFAPWRPYQPYVLEAVVEEGRVRAQLLEADARTLISQSPWVAIDAQTTVEGRQVGLYARDGIARFWGWERSPRALAELTEDAPNRRRLVQDENSPWVIIGPGSWMWTTSEHRRVRQNATVERSSAINRQVSGTARVWECRLKVDPGAGGAGMLFQVNEQADDGFIAWLGGNPGAGALILYRLPQDCLWSGPDGNWHYDTDYLLRAETRQVEGGGEVRAALYASDGETLIQESPWIPVSAERAARPGNLGFMTWLGTAEFWGFDASTSAAPGTPGGTGPAQGLGPGWVLAGQGSWEWADEERGALRQTGASGEAKALNRALAGIMGRWQCRVMVGPETAAAGLLFQTSADFRQGFAAVLCADGFRLEDLTGKVLWENPDLQWERETEYVVEGEVMTDRVAVRLLAADGTTVLTECPAVYVSDTNNRRSGYLGVITRDGPARFWALSIR